jgi:ATP-binding cassette subfamily F protein uup
VFVQPGNYSYYLEKKKERETLEKNVWNDAKAAKTIAPVTVPAVKMRKLSFKEQKELDGIEDSIHAHEKKAADIDAVLNDPNFYVTRSQEASGLISDLEATKAKVVHLYERWEELEKIASGTVPAAD